jgi:hypothetical protein
MFSTYFYYVKVFQTLYTTNYKPIIEQHDGLLIMIKNILTFLFCIYVQKYDCMNNNVLCLIDDAFSLVKCSCLCC